MENQDYTRRSFFKFALAAMSIVPFALKSANAVAAGCPTTPPAGKALAKVGEGPAKVQNYTEDGKASTDAKHKPGQNCENCNYFQDKKAEGGYAPCVMMGMKYVTSCGWCKAYTPKAKKA